MTWSYGDPSASAKDAVRFEVGDTDKTKPQVQDEDIYYVLGLNSQIVLKAAARIAEHLAAKYTRMGSVRNATIANDKMNVAKEYRELANRLRARATRATSFIAPSISVSEKETNELDTDIVQGRIKRGIHDDQENDASNPMTDVG